MVTPPPSVAHQSRNNDAILDYKRFLIVFFRARGTAQILIVSTLLSFGIGSGIGLIPATLANRYASIYHGFTAEDHYHNSCSDYDIKPPACQAGSDDARAAATWSNVVLSMLMLLINPVVGSLSDVYGRKPCIVISLALSTVPAAVFLLLLVLPNMHPAWYYASNSVLGAVNYLSIIFAALSDVVPLEFRAPSYGILLSGFFGGFALAPSIAMVLHRDIEVAIFSLVLTASALILALAFLPETLPDQVRLENVALQQQQQQPAVQEDGDVKSSGAWLWHAATRPLREVSILNRDWAIRLLTVGSFFSAMVYAADATFIIFYIQESLDVQKADIAYMTLVLGVAGIFVQGVLLQPLIGRLGEKGLLIASYMCGTFHNFLYGVARSKETIYVAFVASQFTKTNLPILSSLASQNVDPHEQGRVQGALFATNAIANAVGPLLLEYVYHCTKNKKANYYLLGGPGFMFIVAAALYAIGTVIVSFIPVQSAAEQQPQETSSSDSAALEHAKHDSSSEGLQETTTVDLEEPLLSSAVRAA